MSEALRIYTDGSYSATRPNITYGAYVCPAYTGISEVVSTTNNLFIQSNNVGGEILAAMRAIEFAVNVAQNIDTDQRIETIIYHDYEGISKWVTGEWQAKKTLTQFYKWFATNMQALVIDKMKFTFIHVNGHSGNSGNEAADGLAANAFVNPECKDMNEYLERLLERYYNK